jgi:hypothetical protein
LQKHVDLELRFLFAMTDVWFEFLSALHGL